MTELLLTGLDGKNPLAFLAALGVLDVLADRAKDGHPVPKLIWRAGGTYVPEIVDGPGREALLDVLGQDLESFKAEPAVDLRYPKGNEKKVVEAWDLKPPRERFRAYLLALVSTCTRDRRRSLDFAAAFATDVAVDKADGKTKPTALHFTAGQQEFLKTFGAISDVVGEEDLREALFGPWKRAQDAKQFNWDNAGNRDYALRGDDPSKAEKLGVPGADWLAFRGLPFIRVAPVGDQIATTGCSGQWKTGAFRWPIWTVPLTRAVVRSLLTSGEVSDVDPHVLRARGIAIVFESAIRRSDQGGYGSFAPARVAVARVARSK